MQLKNKIYTLFFLSIIIIIVSVLFIQNRIVSGASKASEDGKYPVSKSFTLLAKQNPDEFYNRMLPYSLMGGLIAGVLFFCLGLLIIRISRSREK